MNKTKYDETEKYTLQDLTPEQIHALNSLLNGCSEKVLDSIRKAIIKMVGYPNDKFRIEIKETIKSCQYCGGSEKCKVGNLQTMSNDIETCDVCNGEGRRVKITSVRYEMLTENKKIAFAR